MKLITLLHSQSTALSSEINISYYGKKYPKLVKILLLYYKLGVSSKFLQCAQKTKLLISVESPNWAEQNSTNNLCCSMYSCQDILYNRNVSNGFEDKNKYLTDQVLESTIIHFQRKWLEHVFKHKAPKCLTHPCCLPVHMLHTVVCEWNMFGSHSRYVCEADLVYLFAVFSACCLFVCLCLSVTVSLAVAWAGTFAWSNHPGV